MLLWLSGSGLNGVCASSKSRLQPLLCCLGGVSSTGLTGPQSVSNPESWVIDCAPSCLTLFLCSATVPTVAHEIIHVLRHIPKDVPLLALNENLVGLVAATPMERLFFVQTALSMREARKSPTRKASWI